MSTTPFPTLMLGPEMGFAGGTRVHTPEGLKPIESIRAGDRVLSHPDHTPPPNRRREHSEYLYRRVTRTTSIEVASLLSITIQNLADGIESTLLVATGQPIWTKPSGWLAAQDVRTGHAVTLSFNGNALVQKVQPIGQSARVYWLEVEDCHSYYVEQLGAWVACNPEAVVQTVSGGVSGGYNKVSLDLSQSQTLLEIKDYYNDTLAPPEPPRAGASELAEQMRAAAEKLRRALKEQMGKELGYDEDGIRWLDGYIDKARLRPSNDQWKSAIHSMGAFLGECMVHHLDGQWSRHEGAPCVSLGDALIAFPHHKVAKQFSNGAEGGNSILGAFQVCKSLLHQSAANHSLTLGQLEAGHRFIEISYGPGRPRTDDRQSYSTTLKNISSRRIRITKFGGFTAQGNAWKLANVNGGFYTADQFKEWYAQKTEWLLPGEIACDDTNWGDPPVVWAYHGVTDTGESFIAGKLLEKPVAAPASPSGRHFVQPMPPQPEMAQIIHKLRTSFESRQQRMSAITLAALTGPRPSWVEATDGLAEFFAHQELLLTEGQITWGAVVQANSLLFKPGDANCPGLLVHSPDHYFDARPRELQQIGRTFFSFKNTEQADPELKEVARLVTDEVDRSMGIELPKVFSSQPVRSATFMVFRKHVPNGVLSGGLFPILTHPSTTAVMMVPFEFWPIELIVLWKENRL